MIKNNPEPPNNEVPSITIVKGASISDGLTRTADSMDSVGASIRLAEEICVRLIGRVPELSDMRTGGAEPSKPNLVEVADIQARALERYAMRLELAIKAISAAIS